MLDTDGSQRSHDHARCQGAPGGTPTDGSVGAASVRLRSAGTSVRLPPLTGFLNPRRPLTVCVMVLVVVTGRPVGGRGRDGRPELSATPDLTTNCGIHVDYLLGGYEAVAMPACAGIVDHSVYTKVARNYSEGFCGFGHNA